MRFVIACVCTPLLACGPVVLGADASAAGTHASPGVGSNHAAVGTPHVSAAGAAGADGANSGAASPPQAAAVIHALLSVTASECGRCFDLVAGAAGGAAPYAYLWEDGSRSPTRRVCMQSGQSRDVSLVVEDASALRSAPRVTQLTAAGDDVPCETAHRLCIQNPSFEGTPALNLGLNFDAVPWTTCNNDPNVRNTPDIADDALASLGNAPTVLDGVTYLALGRGEQVSQALCEDLQPGMTVHVELSVAQADVTPGDGIGIFLEVWGGLAATCSQQQLLWASPKLASSWTRYCMTLKPVAYMNQITLRAKTEVATLTPEYLVVDDLMPVDKCP